MTPFAKMHLLKYFLFFSLTSASKRSLTNLLHTLAQLERISDADIGYGEAEASSSPKESQQYQKQQGFFPSHGIPKEPSQIESNDVEQLNEMFRGAGLFPWGEEKGYENRLYSFGYKGEDDVKSYGDYSGVYKDYKESSPYSPYRDYRETYRDYNDYHYNPTTDFKDSDPTDPSGPHSLQSLLASSAAREAVWDSGSIHAPSLSV